MKWSGLISENVRGVQVASIGRLSFWIVLFILCFMWLKQWPVPDTLYWTWMTLVGYNIVKKPIEIINNAVNKTQGEGLDKFIDN